MAKQTLPSNKLIALLSSKNGIKLGASQIKQLHTTIKYYDKAMAWLTAFVNTHPTVKNKAFLTKYQKKQTAFKKDAEYIIDSFGDMMSFKRYPLAAVKYEGIGILIDKIESTIDELVIYSYKTNM